MEKQRNNKYSYLLKNMGILTISNFGSKILSFLLIPLYTSVLTTSEYGTYDLYLTTLSLFIPILTLNIVDAVIRFSMDSKYDTNKVFSVGVNYILKSCVVFLVIISLNHVFDIFKIFNDYWIYLFFMYIGNVVYDLFVRFARGIDRVVDVAIAGFLNTAATLLFNILFLLVFKYGLIGYFRATIYAYLVAIVYLAIRISVFKRYNFKQDYQLKSEMLSYSKPLIVDTLSWWITNVSDRYIIIWLVGVAANGIYSLAYKIPSVLNLFQSIFMQAWILSAVKEFDNKAGKFYSDIYSIYNTALVMICSILIIFDKMIAKILFAKDFYSAWQYAPFLMISVLFGSLCAVYNGIFNAAKDSKTLANTTLCGAILNIIGNVVLVHFVGTIGAAISTMLSYLCVWGLRTYKIKTIIKLKLPYLRHICSYFILLFQCIVLSNVKQTMICYSIEFIAFIFLMILYKKEIVILFRKVCRRTRNE